MKMIWRDDPPRRVERDDPTVIAWAFRGRLCREGEESINHEQHRPSVTSPRGIVVELMVEGDDGYPYWVMWRQLLFRFHDLHGQWCPIRVGEES